jgi:hypothetical protein
MKSANVLFFSFFVEKEGGRGKKIPTCHYTNTKLRLNCFCLIKRNQNTGFCQKNGIHLEKSHNKWRWRSIENISWPIMWDMKYYLDSTGAGMF